MKKVLLPILFTLSFISSFSQKLERPKLVVGIVVDQMRWDYLYRFYDRYSDKGFKRILRDGFTCENTMIPYVPTVTAIGHSSIYTGSVPALHGIMGNTWYDPKTRKVLYCTDDSSARPIGTTAVAGRMSPRNLWASTITDELRIAQNFRNKTIAFALKDRGSILPGGRTANAAYWFDSSSAGWITSSFYMNSLPDWLQKFNDQKIPEKYIQQDWTTMYPIETYVQSTGDSMKFEGRVPDEDNVFPHKVVSTGQKRFEAFRYIPAADLYTFETAMAAIDGEELGTRGVTDFLALSFSTTDYIGHTFGPNSIEIEDAYLRFDKDLENFLKFLDSKIGKGEYLLFLTADHGAANNADFLIDKKMNSGVADITKLRKDLNETLQKTFGVTGIISQSINYQLFFDYSILEKNKIDRAAVVDAITKFFIGKDGIAAAIDLKNIPQSNLNETLKTMLTNGYNQRFSGDMELIYQPQWFESSRVGTSHGFWNPYDAHIPLLWFGWKIKPGRLVRETYMTDIAPTLAALLRIQMPNASIGKVITEVVR